MFILAGSPFIISLTILPVAAPRLNPNIAWPVATTKFLYLFTLPMQGNPSAEHGLYPDQILSFSGKAMSASGKYLFTASRIPLTLFILGGVFNDVISIVLPNL